MENNTIKIEQAYYGEVERAHSCINQTINDPDLTSFLITFTDRPGALSPGVKLTPYLSGVAFSKYYIFSKTYSDPYATRAGMVFTHVLIVSIHYIKKINNLEDIFKFFIKQVPDERRELNTITISLSNKKEHLYSKLYPQFLQQTISYLIKGELPILFSGDTKIYKTILQQIWNIPIAYNRKKIKFRTSFSPSDIEGINDLTIVYIQEEFLSKWTEKNIISSENNKLINITSPSETLLLGNLENNSFYSFISDLNIDTSDIQNIGKSDKIYNDYIYIDNINDPDIIRQDIRIIALLSPLPSDGKKIKEIFLSKLTELIQSGKDTNLKALRNINWEAYFDGEKKAKQIVFNFIKNELVKKTLFQVKPVSELLEISLTDTIKNWWHISITKSFSQSFSNCDQIVAKNVWTLIDYSQNTLKNVFSIFPKEKNDESILIENIPQKLKKETIVAVEDISKKRKWFLLHANVLLKYLPLDKAITKQLTIEESLKLENSKGVIYLCNKLTDEQFTALTLSNCNSKFVELIVKRITNNKYILKKLDVSKPCWLKIWSSCLEVNQNISIGIEGNEKKVVYSVLDLIIDNKPVPEIIIKLISDSIYADISKYKNRAECWSKLPPKISSNFIAATAKEVLKQYIDDDVSIQTIEKPLLDYISSDTFMAVFLNENRDNIEPVIKVHESISGLKDDFLSDYIKNYPNSIDENNAIRLGTLVKNLNYKNSAKSIYDKSQYNYSFKISLDICVNLVNLPWWESLWGFKKTKQTSIPDIIKSLPTVVILTAIQEEYNAVREHLVEIDDVVKNDTVYEAGLFKMHDRKIAKVIIRECGAKNTIAAQETERAIQYFTPQMLLFVGIAGSRKPNDFAIGDVIFPKEIYSYEAGKSGKDSFLSRPDLASTTYSLMELAKKERRKKDWKILIKNKYNQDIKADLGIIASGEKLIEHYSSGVGEIITKYYNDTSAVEMEGFGFAKTATRQGRDTNKMLVGVIRGISDIIEQPKNNNTEHVFDRRPENAKKLASDTAAAFAYWLIYKYYE